MIEFGIILMAIGIIWQVWYKKKVQLKEKEESLAKLETEAAQLRLRVQATETTIGARAVEEYSPAGCSGEKQAGVPTGYQMEFCLLILDAARERLSGKQLSAVLEKRVPHNHTGLGDDDLKDEWRIKISNPDFPDWEFFVEIIPKYAGSAVARWKLSGLLGRPAVWAAREEERGIVHAHTDDKGKVRLNSAQLQGGMTGAFSDLYEYVRELEQSVEAAVAAIARWNVFQWPEQTPPGFIDIE